MSENSDLDDFFEYETSIKNLENEIHKKIELLNRKQNILNRKKAEPIQPDWFQSIENNLPKVLLEKIEELTQNLGQKDGSDYLKLVNLLKEIYDQQIVTLTYLSKSNGKQKAELKRLQKNYKYVDNKELFASDSEDENSENVAELNTKSSRLFELCKQKLNFTLETFFNDNMKELVKDLTTAYFRGGDEQYISVDPSYFREITLLREADLTITHSADPLKIKFDKFY